MAERRMFTKKVTDDDNFMALSSSAQALYLHLSMSADDDGFCNQVSISMFKAHASVQDLQSLLEKRYIYQFDNGVIVIKHWRMANALRKDRYTQTAFQEELAKLDLKENGAYTLRKEEESEIPSKDQRSIAYENSSLPYSFDYKIRRAFYGKACPICGAKMQVDVDECGIESKNRIPTIQHNIPISKGGKHELGNISVICKQCNVSLRDTETGRLNADDVIEEWEKITGCRLVANCLPQVSIEESREEKSSEEKKDRRFTPPSLEEVTEYVNEKGYHFDPEQFVSFYSSKGWKVGSQPMKDWHAACVTWEGRWKQNHANEPQKPPKRNARPAETHDYNFDDIDSMLLRKQKEWK